MAEQLSLAIQAKDIQGLLFGVDRKQIDKPIVVDGRNFLFNAKGPYSGWGRRLASKAVIPNPAYVQSFHVNDGESLIFTRDTIYRYNSIAQIFFPIYWFTSQTDYYLWTAASPVIAGKYYFCRKGVGVLEYNSATGAITLMTNVNIPTEPLSVANVRGRLVILGRSAYAWSALDNANDLTPSLTTGAGIQSLAILGGIALKVIPLNDAFLVFTTAGIIIAEFSGGQAVFRHRVLTTKRAAVNALCIEELDTGVAVFLDHEGLHITDGKIPEEFQPLFNEFLRAELFLNARSPDFTNYMLFHIHETTQFAVFVSITGEDEIFERAYFLYRPINKFSTFDDRFRNFIHLPIITEVGIEENHCVVNPDGSLSNLTGESFIETTTKPSDAVFWRTNFDWPAYIQNGVYVFPTLMTCESEKIWIYGNLQSGWYFTDTIIAARSITP